MVKYQKKKIPKKHQTLRKEEFQEEKKIKYSITKKGLT